MPNGNEQIIYKSDILELNFFEKVILIKYCPRVVYGRVDASGRTFMEICAAYKGVAYKISRINLPDDYDYTAPGSMIQPNSFSVGNEGNQPMWKRFLRKVLGIDSENELRQKYTFN